MSEPVHPTWVNFYSLPDDELPENQSMVRVVGCLFLSQSMAFSDRPFPSTFPAFSVSPFIISLSPPSLPTHPKQGAAGVLTCGILAEKTRTEDDEMTRYRGRVLMAVSAEAEEILENTIKEIQASPPPTNQSFLLRVDMYRAEGFKPQTQGWFGAEQKLVFEMEFGNDRNTRRSLAMPSLQSEQSDLKKKTTLVRCLWFDP